MKMHNAGSTKVTKFGLQKDTIFLPPQRFFAPLGVNANNIKKQPINIFNNNIKVLYAHKMIGINII